MRPPLILASIVVWLASCAAREAQKPPANEVLPGMIQELFDALPAALRSRPLIAAT